MCCSWAFFRYYSEAGMSEVFYSDIPALSPSAHQAPVSAPCPAISATQCPLDTHSVTGYEGQWRSSRPYGESLKFV